MHLRHDNAAIPPQPEAYPGVAVRTMGSWLAERRRDELYTIGLYAYRGQTVDNRGRPYALTEVLPGSLESILGSTRVRWLFLDLSAADDEPGATWIGQPLTAKLNGRHDMVLVPRDQYDGVIFVHTVSPREKYRF